ncbi:Mis18-binding protein 1 [Varanus komodoensis]|nr:Mis18-binding protein 1 [Varanus komodoensis]
MDGKSMGVAAGCGTLSWWEGFLPRLNLAFENGLRTPMPERRCLGSVRGEAAPTPPRGIGVTGAPEALRPLLGRCWSARLTLLLERAELPLVVAAKVGTLKRRRQMRHFLEQMPKDNHDDIFAASPLQNRNARLPQFCKVPEEDVFHLKGSHPITPLPALFPLAKTPECEHVSPGMLESLDRNECDRRVFHMQKSIGGQERTWKNVKKKAVTFLSLCSCV